VTDCSSYVLVVDDDYDILESLQIALELEGYRVQTASHGIEALGILHSSPPPCVILLDLMMPIMDGWTFRTMQRAEAALANIPTVVFSGGGDLPEHATKLGVTEYVAKPPDWSKLLDTIARYCKPAAPN
jgi:DNA-binding NtrC family response regulator